MNRIQALECLASCGEPQTKIAEVYDDDAGLREALSVLIPNFEYPDISYLTLAQLHRRCSSQADLATT